jgi:hypothetical protein
MATLNWNLLSKVQSLDEVKAIAKSNGVCQCRVNNLKNCTKYSFKCCQYRKYSLCNYEIKATVQDDDPHSITIMYRNAHNHEYRAETTRLPSPVRQNVSKYVHVGLTESQIRALIELEHPDIPVPSTKLTAVVQSERRKNRPTIFSVFDFRQWCSEHQGGDMPHATLVPFYFINDVNNLFVLFTTKELIRQIQYSPLLQVDATYKLTWNELPLLVFGASDCKRNFRPFGLALVCDDEDSTCFEHLFNSLQS